MNIDDLTPEHCMNKVVSFVWRGLHNAPKIHKERISPTSEMWELNAFPLATFDFDGLTRLVLAAHEYAIRAEVGPSGPGRVKVRLWSRKREGAKHDRHPELSEVAEMYRENLQAALI